MRVAMRGLRCAAVAVLGTACVPDLPVPPAAHIGCTKADDCPSGFTCRENIHRCVSVGATSDPAPELQNPVLSPTSATRGTAVHLTFGTDKALGADPVVSLEGAGGAHWDADPSGTDAAARKWAFVHTVTGADPEGEVRVSAELTNEAGNAAARNAGTVRLDFAPPAAAGLHWELPEGKAAIGAAESEPVRFSGTADSDAVLVSATLIGSDGRTLADATSTTTVAPSTVQPGRADVAGSVDLRAVSLADLASVAVDLVLADALGNRTAPGAALVQPVPVDLEPPTDPRLTLHGKPVTGAQSVEADVSASGATAFFLSGDVMRDENTFQWVAKTFPAAVTVTLTPGDGTKAVHALFRDAAWNQSTAADDSIGLVTGPVRSNPELVPPPGQDAVKNGDVLGIAGSGEAGATVASVRLASAAGADAQVVPAGTVSLDDDGRFSGSCVAQGLVDGTRVSLEIVLRARGAVSDAASSRSAQWTVDLVAPAGATVQIAAFPDGQTDTPVVSRVVATRDVVLLLSAVGATKFMADGDLEDGDHVRRWVDLAPSVPVRLTEGDGPKSVFVAIRDGADNRATAHAGTSLDTSAPHSVPTLSGPWTVEKVKDLDTLAVGGAASPGSTIRSAALLHLDSTGALLPGSGCTVDESEAIRIDPAGNFHGTVGAAGPCEGAASVVLEVVVANVAGAFSTPEESRSEALALDNDPPSGVSVSLRREGIARENQTPQAAIVLLLAAEEPDGGPVQAVFSGDLTPGSRVGSWVDFPGPETHPGEEELTLAGTGGSKSVAVRFRDAVRNETTARTLLVNLDTTPPAAPVARNVRLEETSPAPDDPALADGASDVFTLTGLASAAGGADRVVVFSDAELAHTVVMQDVGADGSFAGTQVASDAAKTWYVATLDAAGNRSPSAIAVTVPRFTGIAANPNPARSGAAISITFASSVPLAANPVVTVAGRAATFTSLGAGYVYGYTPDGTESEGRGLAVVRVAGVDGGTTYASGTTGTDAVAMSLDFTPPVLEAVKWVLHQNDSGTEDTIEGLVDAASDNVDHADELRVEILPPGSATPVATASVRADGSFGSVAFGDDRQAAPRVRLVDRAGNASNPQTLANDIVAPSVSALVVAPAAQHDDADVTISFTVSDGAHDLRAAPTVTVGGRAATRVSGDLATHGATVPCVYRLHTDGATDAEQVAPVFVAATDAVGNTGRASSSVTLDFTAPASTCLVPGTRTLWNAATAAMGTASDGLSGVAKVEVAVRLDGATDAWWNGTTFAAGPTWLAAAGTIGWTAELNAVQFAEGAEYTLKWRATDAAGNVETPGAGSHFTYTSNTPAPPSGFAAAPAGAARVHLSWQAPSSVPDQYLIFYDTEAGTHPPYLGRGATQGDSPISVAGGATQLDLTGLPTGRYEFAVLAVDANGLQSALSAPAAAASRRWRWVHPALGSRDANKVVYAGAHTFVAVGAGGTVWRSTDDGVTWAMPDSGTTEDLVDAWTGGSNVVAVGSAGAIARSTDRGASWSVAHVSGITSVTRIAGDGSTVFALGSSALRSADGGATWTTTTLAVPAAPKDLWVGGTNVVVVGGGGQIGRSTDGGATWSAPASGRTVALTKVAGDSAGLVAVGSDGSLTRSGDVGATWAPVTSGMATFGLASCGGAFLAFGGHYTGFFSPDAGATWQSGIMGGRCYGEGVGKVLWCRGGTLFDGDPFAGSGSGPGICVGAMAPDSYSAAPTTMPTVVRSIAGSDNAVVAVGQAGLIVRQSSGTWTVVNGPAPRVQALWSQGARAVAVGSDFAGLSGSGPKNCVARSDDGGETWQNAGVSSWESVSLGVVAGDGATVLATGGPYVYRSADGGATWSQSPYIDNGLTSLAGGNGAWVVAAGYDCYRSTSAGATWTRLTDSVGDNLIVDSLWGDGIRFFAGSNQQPLIYRSTDSGAHWAESPAPFGHLRGFWVAGETAVGLPQTPGDAGSAALSTDGGGTWAPVNLNVPSTSLMNAIDGAGSLVIAVGNAGVVTRSADAGATWTLVPPPGSADLLRVRTNGTDAVAVGPETLLQSSDGGASWTQVAASSVEGRGAAAFGTVTDAVVFEDGTALVGGDAGILRFGPP